ncbi:hypothetical protein ACFV8T_30230 [Streptomyces sp. NPDC059832]|uniref:hypothetical protein n=1 Tax=unclassified Streptomyces TaxID=2593676 RepID=UPI0036682977
MTDEQLGAAIRPGVHDERDLDRIGTEGDGRDEQACSTASGRTVGSSTTSPSSATTSSP